VEACPSNALEFSKEYNKVAFTRDDFDNMDLVKNVEAEAKVWAETHPQPAPAPAPSVAAADTPSGSEPKPSGEAPKSS